MTQFWKTTNEGSGSLNFLYILLRIATMQAMANFLCDIMWFLIAYLPYSSSVGSVVDPDPHPDPLVPSTDPSPNIGRKPVISTVL